MPNMDWEPSKSKRLAKVSLEEITHEVIQTAVRAGLSVSLLELPCVCPHALYSFSS